MTYLPTICIILFVCLFIYCTTLYPGSSQHDITSEGFSWQYNYWCDILDQKTYSEVSNPAYTYGIIATLILCLGTAILFYQFPQQFGASPTQSLIISGFGICSMIAAALIFTPLHNIVIGIASALALIALIFMFFVMWKNQEWSLFYFGIVTCVIMLANNFMYYTRFGIDHLPWIQKISMLIVLLWIIMINIEGASKAIN